MTLANANWTYKNTFFLKLVKTVFYRIIFAYPIDPVIIQIGHLSHHKRWLFRFFYQSNATFLMEIHP